MAAENVVGIISDVVQSIAIILGLWLTIKSWNKTYNLTIKAQNENLRNIVWDRAGGEIFASIKAYNNWLIELHRKLDFFIEVNPLDERFIAKEQNWRSALLEIFNKLGQEHAPYQEWLNKIQYYGPALTDIDKAKRESVIERHEEIISKINGLHEFENNFPGVEKGKHMLSELIPIVASQGAEITELGEIIQDYCMKKTFFIETKI